MEDRVGTGQGGAPAGGPREPRAREGLSFVRLLRPALYALLVTSAVFAFWAGGEIAGHQLPRQLSQVAPLAFAAFLVAFAVYRVALIRAKRYPAANGLFQIGLGVLVWVLLLPGSRRGIEGPPPAASAAPASDDVAALLASPDPRVRALAAEVAGARGGIQWAGLLLGRLADPDPRVRAAARAALVRLAGSDPAPGLAGDEAAERFRELGRARGWPAPSP